MTKDGFSNQILIMVKDRLARWREAQKKALGIEQTETLPELSEAEVLDIKRRTVRRGDSS